MGTAKQIAPSVLSADFSRLGEEIRAVEAAGADLIHLDVMDGHFVPNITAGPILVEATRKVTQLPLDAHLMIENPEKYIPDFAEAGANWISVHVEVLKTPARMKKVFQLIRKHGAKPSIALNPKTPLKSILPVLREVDMVLVMTVNPGFGGQSFIPTCVKKVAQLRKILDEKKLAIEIEVDGGIKADNIGETSRAGATVFVAGSAIFKSPDYQTTIYQLRHNASFSF
ncbi:MAG: ribulose-phosphate 3-epimerase [Deltaproteobacteria bacterium]|nr:ribulose-phosphate 3-epimerase [Deltaproteobacteria bacterium]